MNSAVIASTVRAIVQTKAPKLLETYKFSRRWCRNFVAQQLGWGFRKGTTSGQKLPADWEASCEQMRQRAAAIAASNGVTHPSLVINWDQTGINLMPTFDRTYCQKGSKQVPITAIEDKRQITAVVATTAEGELLPIQLIFAGKEFDKKGKPLRGACPKDAVSLKLIKDNKWHVIQSDSHWSTQTTMQDYVKMIIDPFIKAKIKQHQLPAGKDSALLLIDVWKVHKSQEFRSWMANQFPNYHIVFIPAGCTGVMQPADVLIQRPLKHEFSNQFTTWATEEMRKQLASPGSRPQDVKLHTDLGTLKPLVLQWFQAAASKLSHWTSVTMIQSGWEKLGLTKILDPAFQVESLRLVAKKQLDLEKVEPGEEQLCQSASDEYVEDEAEGDADDDEEDGDVDAALAACMEHRLEIVEEDRRRSSRIRSQSQRQSDRRIASLLQEQTLDETCYILD